MVKHRLHMSLCLNLVLDPLVNANVQLARTTRPGFNGPTRWSIRIFNPLYKRTDNLNFYYDSYFFNALMI